MRHHWLCLFAVPALLTWGCTSQSEKKASPEEIYQNTCQQCHGNGIAGAPVVGNAEDWKPRIAQGIDTLVDHAMNGFDGMPAKGGNPALNREEITAAVQYMVEKSR